MFRSSFYGQATLSFVLLVGGIILEIAIAGSFITYFLSTSGLGERLSARAYTAAETGLRDAEIKLSRDKELGNRNYSLVVGDDTASIQVSKDATDPTNYVYTITSTGLASSRQRKLITILVVNRISGLIQFQSLSEQTVE